MTPAASPQPLHLFSLPETLIPETPTVAHAKPLLRCHLPTEVSLVTSLTPPSINWALPCQRLAPQMRTFICPSHNSIRSF